MEENQITYRFLKDIKKLNNLKNDQLQNLITEFYFKETSDERKEEIIHEIIEGTLQYVVRFIKKYMRAYIVISKKFHVSFLDIIQYGIEGVYKAIHTYNKEKMSSFRTHIGYCVRWHIMRKLDMEERLIRIPTYHLTKIRVFDRKQNEDPSNISKFYKKFVKPDTVIKANTVYNSNIQPINDRTKYIIEKDPDIEITINSILDILKDIKHEQAKKAFILIYGLDQNPLTPRTYEEVSKIMKISRQRVFQLRTYALIIIRKKLKLPYKDLINKSLNWGPGRIKYE